MGMCSRGLGNSREAVWLEQKKGAESSGEAEELAVGQVGHKKTVTFTNWTVVATAFAPASSLIFSWSLTIYSSWSLWWPHTPSQAY